MARDTKVGNVVAGTALDTTGWKKGTKELKDSAREAKESTEKNLRELAGRGSDLHGILRVVTGGVINEIGRQFSEATGKVVEMRDALREGKITQDEMARSVAESIPLVGSFVKGFADLRELLTGEKEEIDEIKEGAKATTGFFDEWAAGLIKSRRELEQINQNIAASNRSAAAAFGGKTLITEADIRNEREKRFGKDGTRGGTFDDDWKAKVTANNAAMDDLRGKRDALPEYQNLRAAEENAVNANAATSQFSNPLTFLRGTIAQSFGHSDRKYADAKEEFDDASAGYNSQINDLAKSNSAIIGTKDSDRSAELNKFDTDSAKKLLGSAGEYHLGITGRQSRFGGGIAYNGNTAGANVQERIAAILEANAADTKRAAFAGEQARDALRLLVGNRK